MPPTFSIVIPTKNRPALLKEAMTSVILQNFNNFELVISDDSDDDKARVVVEGFEDKRIRYLKPKPGMNMPTHFEWATRQSEGEYTMLFPDRSIMMQGALRKLDKIIRDNPAMGVVYFPWFIFDETRSVLCGQYSKSKGKERLVESTDVLREFVNNPENFYSMPRNLNTLYSRKVADDLRDKFGSLFMELNPDFTFAFLVLSQFNELLYVDQPLFISQGLAASTGNKPISSYVGDGEVFYNTPLDVPVAMNTFFEDFLRMKKIADKNLGQFDINRASYFFAVYKDFIYKKKLFTHDEFSKNLRKLRDFKKSFTNSEKRELKKRRAELLIFTVKTFINNSSASNFFRTIKRKIDFLRIKGFRIKYKSVLEAAGFNE